jgi:glycosyltransferase involved in cell wall biosynthesis
MRGSRDELPLEEDDLVVGSNVPTVSIVLCTYNRADTLMRAVDSVVKQTFRNWELVLVDDGSTDATAEMDFAFDPRIRVVRQPNAGVSAARNTGLGVSRGRFITFLDSDDEWLPHFLEVSIGFLQSAPAEHYVTTEFLRGDTTERDNKFLIERAYVPAAQMIGSHSLDMPPGENDEYMRVFESKRPLGAWATKYAGPGDYLYQGNIFRHTRWGYFAWLPTTVLTRHALDVVGGFDVRARAAGDYPFLARLARHFNTNFISLPCARKHDIGLNSRPLTEGHLATGAGGYFFRVNRLGYFDQLHWSENPTDPELTLIRRHYVYKTACLALRDGLRHDAIRLFGEASAVRWHFWRAYVLRLFALCVPGAFAVRTYRFWRRFAGGSPQMHHMNI